MHRMGSDRRLPEGRAAVLDIVKWEGPVTAETLAARLGITGMAVRQHLDALLKSGLTAFDTKSSGRGRPPKLWRVTGAADSHFPDAHSALAADLISQMRQAFGEEGLDRLVALRTAQQERTYSPRVAAKTSLKSRLDALAKLRSEEGYMAEVRRDRETGAWLFVENHCPICAAARLCTGLCREELSLFQRVLGKDVRVERISHILVGASRCAYRVSIA
ncbi:MAG TPA: metalloregulator ArsR/SmtB family transcription factor [Rhizomicrobium sp.]